MKHLEQAEYCKNGYQHNINGKCIFIIPSSSARQMFEEQKNTRMRTINSRPIGIGNKCVNK